MVIRNKLYFLTRCIFLLFFFFSVLSISGLINNKLIINLFSYFYPRFVINNISFIESPFNIYILAFFVIIPLILFFVLILLSKDNKKIFYILLYFTIIDSTILCFYDAFNNNHLFLYLDIIKILLTIEIIYLNRNIKVTFIKKTTSIDCISMLIKNDFYRRMLFSTIFLFILYIQLYYIWNAVVVDYGLTSKYKLFSAFILIYIYIWLFYFFISYVNKNIVQKGQIDNKSIMLTFYTIARYILLFNFYMTFKCQGVVITISNFFSIYASAYVFFYTGIEKILLVILSLIPLIVYMFSFFLSKKNWNWMLVPTIISWLDELLIIIYNIYVNKVYFDLLNSCQIVILLILTEGTILGQRIKHDLPTYQKSKKDHCDVKIYSYNFKSSKIVSLIFIVLIIFVIFVAVGLELLIIYIGDNYELNTFQTLLLICLISSPFIIFGIFVKHIVVRVFFWKTYYYRKNRWIYMVCDLKYIDTDIYTDLKVYKETKLGYHCYYTDYKNKRRNVFIPKYYPNIEEILYQDINNNTD